MTAKSRNSLDDFISRCGPAAIGARLRRLSESIDEDARRVYADYGVEFEQRWVGVVEQLALSGPLTVAQLASALGVRHSSVSQTRASLERAGIIEMLDDPDDGRSRKVRLSPRGQRLVARLWPLWQTLNEVSAEIDHEARGAVAALDRLDRALARESLHARVAARGLLTASAATFAARPGRTRARKLA